MRDPILALAALALMLAAPAALADPGSETWGDGPVGVTCVPTQVSRSYPVCILDLVGPTAGNSRPITFRVAVTIEFDPNLAGAGADDATVEIRCANDGDLTDESTEPLNGITLTGVEPDFRRFYNVPPSTCWVDVVTPPGAGETARVTVSAT